MANQIKKISLFIYKRLLKVLKGNEIQKQQSMLMKLYPGKDKEALLQEYYVSKIQKIVIAAILGLFLTVAVYWEEKQNPVVDPEGKIMRMDYGQMDYEAEVVAQLENEDIQLEIKVSEREYTDKQIEEMYKRICEQIEGEILGNNESLAYVTDKLVLKNEIDNYPFALRWESDNYELVNDDGEIAKIDINPSGEVVKLMCYMTYKDYKFEKEFEIKIYPPAKTEQEKIKDEIIASIQTKQEETINEEYLQLPMSIGEKGINWKDSSHATVVLMAILSAIVLIGIWWGVDNDLVKRNKERDQLLRLDYSEFVSKLQLLISSGMTLRGALERMEADYKLNLKEGEKEKYVYEELRICLKRLRDGASEAEVYIMFGNRIGQMSYKKLMTLLVQNLKKGTRGLVEALNYEAKVAFEERKHLAKRLGDEAQTKLLFPMVMMLGVVMIIIIIPAYYSFGI